MTPITPAETDRLLVQLWYMTGGNVETYVELDELARQAGIPLERAETLALDMRKRGLIEYTGYGSGTPGGSCRITPAGNDRAFYKSLPWRKWLFKDPRMTPVWTAITSGILAGAVLKLLSLLFPS
jgi:hypothetical protein